MNTTQIVNAHILAQALVNGATLTNYTKGDYIQETEDGVATVVQYAITESSTMNYYSMLSTVEGFEFIEETNYLENTVEVLVGSKEEKEKFTNQWVIWPIFYELFQYAIVVEPNPNPRIKFRMDANFASDNLFCDLSQVKLDLTKLERLINLDLIPEAETVEADYSRPIVYSTEMK